MTSSGSLNGYLLTLSALILLGGSLGDRVGRRLIFCVGVVWFTTRLGSLRPGADRSKFLIAARVLQGVGGALLTPGSLAIIEATFDPEDRARAIGAWSGLGGIAAAVGPLLGGYLVDSVVVALDLPHQPSPRRVRGLHGHPPCARDADPTASGRLDYPGALLAAAGPGRRDLRPDQRLGGSAAAVTVAAAVWAALLLAAFLLRERRSAESDDAALDLRLEASSRRRTS